MTPPVAPTVPHSTIFRTLYLKIEGWADSLHLPSWLREVLRGLIFGGLVFGAITLAKHYVVPSVFLGGTAINVLYALKLDPNDAGKPSEVPDFMIAEMAVAAFTILLLLLGAH